MVDSKGYEAEPVTLTININLVEPEQEEEEEEEEEVIQQGGFDFVPDWDKFYADQMRGENGEDGDLLEDEEIIIEEPVNPALIA
jgi:hypothetical protein